MALKIDQIVDQKGNSFDIDLPRDATPAIVSLNADNYIYSSILRMPKMAMNVAHFNTTGTPVETVIKTKIKYISGTHMPVVRIYGYAYGLQSPIELKLGFYIYGGALGWSGVVSMGAWKPQVYLYKYTADSVNYVAIGLKGACYYLGFDVDVQVPCLGSIDGTNITYTGWTTTSTETAGGLIPAVGTNNCVEVPYRASQFNLGITAGGSETVYNGSGSKTLNLDNIYLKLADLGTGLLTIQQNDVTVGSFSANSTVDVTANIVTPKVYRYI